MMNNITFLFKHLKNIITVVVLLAMPIQLMAQYTDGGDLSDDINASTTGGTYIVKNGTYSDFEIGISSRVATEADPIIIKAETIGGVTLTGSSYATFKKSAYITLEGFVFDCTGESTLVKLEGSNNIRITRNVFELLQDPLKTVKWVYIGGVYDDTVLPYQFLSHDNRIDHNIFQNKNLGGHYITIDGTNETVQSQNDRIDHNYFKNNTPREGNEKESVRIGWSEMSMSSGYTTLEFNLFEDCDGDPEIVSVKSCDNVIRHNTFRKSLGTLSLRHGNRNRVEGNYFFGDGKANGTYTDNSKTPPAVSTTYTGGIRVYGKDHVIINNYFENLKGTKWDAPITLTQGDAIDGNSSDLTKHFRAENIKLAYNTLVNNEYGIEIGFDNNNNYNTTLKNIQFANNLVTGSTNSLVSYIEDQTQGSEITWVNNLMYPTGSAVLTSNGSTFTSGQVLVSNPNLEYDAIEGVWRSTALTPTITNGSSLSVNEDIEGQARPTISNQGSDHFSTESVRFAPLTPTDVGPDAYEIDESVESLFLSSVSNFAAAGATQAVTVTSNLTWNVTDDSSWITISPSTGTNNGSFDIIAAKNTAFVQRIGVVTVTGGSLTRTINITQLAADPRDGLNLINPLADDVEAVYACHEEIPPNHSKDNYAWKSLDKNPNTQWAGSAALGDCLAAGYVSIIYDLKGAFDLDLVDIATTSGKTYNLQIWVSSTVPNSPATYPDDSDFTLVYPSSGFFQISTTPTEKVPYTLPTPALGTRYIKIVGDGQPAGSRYTTIHEIEFYGDASVLSVEEDEFASQLKIYPVPAKGILNIQAQQNNIKSIKLFSVDGRKLIDKPVNLLQSEIPLDVSSFSNGTYMLLLTNDSNLTHSKLIYISN